MKLSHITTICIACICSLLFASTASGEDGTDEVERIREHLTDVEEHLRARDVSDWPVELQRERAERLDELRAYREAGLFPRNVDFEDARVPYFIDDRGVACAVAHLMIESGDEEAARTIARRENNAWLMEMTSPEVREWVTSSGLTAEEAAWIQPTYGFCDDIFAEVSGPTTAGCAETFELEATEVPEVDCAANYRWQLTAGEPAPTLEGENERVVTVTLPEFSGTIEYGFELSVSNQGDTVVAQHTVTATCGDDPVNNGTTNNGTTNNGTTNNDSTNNSPSNNDTTNNDSTNNDAGETNNDSDPDPADPDPSDPGPADSDSDSACTTGIGGPSTGLGLLLFFALVLVRRRRR